MTEKYILLPCVPSEACYYDAAGAMGAQSPEQCSRFTPIWDQIQKHGVEVAIKEGDEPIQSIYKELWAIKLDAHQMELRWQNAIAQVNIANEERLHIIAGLKLHGLKLNLDGSITS
jgi:hypothetical protein